MTTTTRSTNRYRSSANLQFRGLGPAVLLISLASLALWSPPPLIAELATTPISFDRTDAGTGSVRENDRWGDVLAAGDFNGDGYTDQAIGVPSGDLIGASEAGFVDVLYGSAEGLTSIGSQTWSQENDGLGRRADDNDRYGAALASGDFDGDGFADLAIGVPNETVEGQPRSGVVALLFGSASGLSAGTSVLLTQQPAWLNEEDDAFGSSLASGDFNGDGLDDLAVGHPNESISSTFGGAVSVFTGQSTRETFSSAAQYFHQAQADIVGADEAGDQWGKRLATGDFDGDGFDELVVGVPNEDIGSAANAGAVVVIRGSSRGLDPALGTFSINQGSAAVTDDAHQGDLFGWSLATGDFDGDGRDDLAIGVWGENSRRQTDDGAVYVQYGSSTGLSTAGQLFIEESDLDPQPPEHGDGLGFALMAGDFDGDGFDELVVGAAEEDLEASNGTYDNAGVAYRIPGGPAGLDQFPATMMKAEMPATEERYGWAFSVGDFDGSGTDDLVVTARHARSRGVVQAGRIDVYLNEDLGGGGGGGNGNGGVFLNQDRFRVWVTWSAHGGASGDGRVVSESDDSVLFYFLEPSNWEMLVKVLDGCALNGSYWVFFAATTDLGLTLTVEDTQTGACRVYSNTLGQAADAVNDTAAFPCT